MNRQVYMLMLIAFVVGMSELIVGGILDLIAKDFHVPVSQVGLLITVFAFVFALSPPIFLVIFAKVERKRLIILSLIVFFFGILLAVVSTNFTFLLLSRILAAASGSVATVLSINLASRVVEPAYRGRAIGLVVMGISGALVFGLPIGVFLGNFINWRAPFVLTALLSFALILAVYYSLDRFAPSQVVSLAEQVRTLKNHRILLAHATTFFFLAGHYTFFGYFTPYAKEILEFNGLTISILYLCFGIAAVSGGGLAGISSDKFGYRNTLFAATILLGLSLLAIPTIGSISLLFWPILLVLGVVSWSITPPIQSFLFTVASDTSDIQQSLNNAALQLGIAFGTLVGSFTIDTLTIRLTPYVGLIFVMLALLSGGLAMKGEGKVRG